MRLPLAILFLLKIVTVHAQLELPSINIKRTVEAIVIDGKGEEEAWKSADVASGFNQYFPFDTSRAEAQTEIRMTYDDNFVYILAKMQEEKEGEYVTPSLRRDFRGSANDGVSIVIDPFQDNINAFMFGINPFGVQREALISNGGSERGSFDLSWDNKWYAETTIAEDHWVAEIAIPFKTLRFREGSDRWNANFYRIDSRYNERSTWTHIPRQFNIFTLAYMGEVRWDAPLKKPGANVSVIPYLSGGYLKNHEEDSDEFTSGVGGDAKVAVTPSLNLDLTFNPDFSQVEVDRQVTNLSRFEIFFPERRQFFLENADLFSNYGFQRSRPFFSRRIGIARDTVEDKTVENQIIYGARLSGKVTDNTRIGVLNMQTSSDDDAGIPSLNFSVLSLQQKVFKRSNVSAFFVNKQNFSESLEDDSVKYNRVFGLDYNLASFDGTWTGKVYYHQSINPYEQGDDYSHGANLNYNHRNYRLGWEHQLVGENFDAQVGFVPRKGFNRINPEVELIFYPAATLMNSHGPEFSYGQTWDDDNGRTDEQLNIGYNFRFRSTANLDVTFTRDYTFLFSDFDPTNTDGIELAEGSDYTYYNYRISFRSNPRRAFWYNVNTNGGEYFNGTRFGVSGNLNFRYQPYGVLALNFNYNRIDLPNPFSDANLFLIGPRIDFTFSRQLFLTTFLQYNNQIDNFNINSRLQWRFKPVSDLFLVYTDNYNTSNFEVKNRAIVLKVTYWLNL